MNLKKLILKSNACYKAGKTITPLGIMFHSTGAMRRAINKQDFGILEMQIDHLKEQREKIQTERINNQNIMNKLVEVRSFLDDQTGEIEEYNDQLVRNLVVRIIVFDDHLGIKFRTGAEIEIYTANELKQNIPFPYWCPDTQLVLEWEIFYLQN